MSGKYFQQFCPAALKPSFQRAARPVIVLGAALLVSTALAAPAMAQSRVVIDPAIPTATTSTYSTNTAVHPPMPEGYGQPKPMPPMPQGYGQAQRYAPPPGYGEPERKIMPPGYGEAKRPGTITAPVISGGRAIVPLPPSETARTVPTPAPAVTRPALVAPVQEASPRFYPTPDRTVTAAQPMMAPQAPVAITPRHAPTISAPRILPQRIVPMPAEQPQPEPIPTPVMAAQPVAPAPVSAPAPVATISQPIAPTPIAPMPSDEPFELPVAAAPAVTAPRDDAAKAALEAEFNAAIAAPEPTSAPEPEAALPVIAPAPAPTQPVGELGQLVQDYGKPTQAEPAPASTETAMPAAPSPKTAPAAIPAVEATAPAAPETPVAEAELPQLSDESKKILDKVPSGIDSPKHVETPEHIVIKRNNPNAGVIPKLDYRAHEELGLKIELRKEDPNVNEYLEQGYSNLMAGNYDIAEGYYKQALAIEPKSSQALFGLATAYHKNKNLDSAREYYGKLLEQDPTNREGLTNFMALISEEAPTGALAELEKLAEANPDFSPIQAQMGLLYNKLGKPEKAAAKLAEALKLEPDNISYKYNLAITLDKLGQKEKAADLYIELIADYNEGANVPGDIEQIKNRAIYLSAHP